MVDRSQERGHMRGCLIIKRTFKDLTSLIFQVSMTNSQDSQTLVSWLTVSWLCWWEVVMDGAAAAGGLDATGAACTVAGLANCTTVPFMLITAKHHTLHIY